MSAFVRWCGNVRITLVFARYCTVFLKGADLCGSSVLVKTGVCWCVLVGDQHTKSLTAKELKASMLVCWSVGASDCNHECEGHGFSWLSRKSHINCMLPKELSGWGFFYTHPPRLFLTLTGSCSTIATSWGRWPERSLRRKRYPNQFRSHN